MSDPVITSLLDLFWQGIEQELRELATAYTADQVVEVCNRYNRPSGGDAFFAGSGGDEQVCDVLAEAGWRYVWSEAPYYWCMKAPGDGSLLTYVEGDIYRGDQHA